MSADDPMVEEFFGEVNDKYYPQVLEGLDLLDEGRVEPAVDILARPLHTIKGVAGFMGGFEPASDFTHKVEDFLKLIQAGDVEPSEANLTLLSRGVNLIFNVLEQIRDTGEPDAAETGAYLEELAAVGRPEAEAETDRKSVV